MTLKKNVLNILILSSLLLHLSCRSESGWAEIFLRKGQTYMKQGKHEHALQEYQKAMRITPDNARALLGAADAYWAMGNCEVAVEEINGAALIEPDIPAAYYYKKAQCLLQRNPPQYKAAVKEALIKAVELDPFQPEFYELTEICYKALGNTELAAAAGNKARSLRSNGRASDKL